MPITTVRNATTSQQIRNSRSATSEVVATGITPVVAQENNAGIVGSDVTAGNAIVYAGSDHIPVGTDQYDANPI